MKLEALDVLTKMASAFAFDILFPHRKQAIVAAIALFGFRAPGGGGGGGLGDGVVLW